jgi:ClpP class serine protease
MSEDIPKTEKILSIEEIQRMFEEMGLGTEEERRRFQPEPEHLPIESPKPERWPTLSNHTRKLQLESPMANWNEVLNTLHMYGSTHDIVRRESLKKLHQVTGRNIITYYSGWLQKPNLFGVALSDGDKNGFMNAIHGLDRSKGLDLLLHTPGGDIAATESIVDYLRSMFDTNIRAIVPQLAMSAGTMIACACKSVVMGKHSSLGPIDPQINGVPTHGILEEFNRAHSEIKADNSKVFCLAANNREVSPNADW